jgi:hypothetical protein
MDRRTLRYALSLQRRHPPFISGLLSLSTSSDASAVSFDGAKGVDALRAPLMSIQPCQANFGGCRPHVHDIHGLTSARNRFLPNRSQPLGLVPGKCRRPTVQLPTMTEAVGSVGAHWPRTHRRGRASVVWSLQGARRSWSGCLRRSPKSDRLPLQTPPEAGPI